MLQTAYHQRDRRRLALLELLSEPTKLSLFILDVIVRHVKGLEVDKFRHRSEFLDLVVRDPELLQCVAHHLYAGQVLDQVPAEAEDGEALHVVQVGDPRDHVGRETQLLTAGQSRQGRVHL